MALSYISLANQVENKVVMTSVSGSGSNTAGQDVSNYEGSILLTISDENGGTNAVTIAVTHSATSGGTYTAVPAAALVNITTNANASFTALSASASTQTLALKKELLQRFVRVEYSGASLTHHTAAIWTGNRKYAP